jgi:hypothetical protein
MTIIPKMQCVRCGDGPLFIAPLHGEKGGPLMCVKCRLQWDQDDRRARAKKVDLLELLDVPVAGSLRKDPCFLTRELLDELLALTHPDHHPDERHAQASRVTAELNRLRTFTPPKPKPKATTPIAEPLSELSRLVQKAFEGVRRIVCETCVATVPAYYCDACKQRWDERRREERERENERQRRRRAWHKTYNTPAISRGCAACGAVFKVNGGPAGRRRDARFCSAACRQRAHRGRRNGYTNGPTATIK